MAIEIKTDRYARSHGKLPRGRGYWAFIFEDGSKDGQVIFIHGVHTLRDASKLVREQIRRRGYQDATLHVAP